MGIPTNYLASCLLLPASRSLGISMVFPWAQDSIYTQLATCSVAIKNKEGKLPYLRVLPIWESCNSQSCVSLCVCVWLTSITSQSDLSLDTIGSYKVLYDFICRIQIELPRDLTLYISFCTDLEFESCQVFSFYYIIVWGVKVIVIVFPRKGLKKVIAPVQALPLNPVRQLYL